MSRVYGESLSIKINEAHMKRVRDVLYGYRNGAERAVQRAVNHGTKRGRKAVVDGIYAKAALKKKDIRQFISFRLASLGTFGGPSAKLIMKSYPLNLMMFGAKQRKKFGGVTFRIWRSGKREKYDHAFIYRIKGAKEERVYETNVDSPRYKKGESIPWRRKSGPGVPTLYEQTPGLAQKAHEAAMDAMMKELDRQVALIDRGLM